MKVSLSFLFGILLSLCVSAQISNQADYLNKSVVATMNDGTELVGEVIEVGPGFMIISSSAIGEITLELSQVKSINEITTSTVREDGSVWFDNPHFTRNFLTETAIGLEKGQVFYQNVLLGGHTFGYGISDQLSVSGGFEVFSILNGGSPILFLQPKFTIPSTLDKLYFGVGANAVAIPRQRFVEVLGSIYGITTLGNKNNNITIGLGVAYSTEGGFLDDVFVQFGGMFRMANHFMIVVDNITIGNLFDNGIGGTFSVRYILRKISIDLGVATDYSNGLFPVLAASFQL